MGHNDNRAMVWVAISLVVVLLAAQLLVTLTRLVLQLAR